MINFLFVFRRRFMAWGIELRSTAPPKNKKLGVCEIGAINRPPLLRGFFKTLGLTLLFFGELSLPCSSFIRPASFLVEFRNPCSGGFQIEGVGCSGSKGQGIISLLHP